ncbi:MAG TPA: hypothetical protein VGF55_26940, partial [Gemmataceae bacterium]
MIAGKDLEAMFDEAMPPLFLRRLFDLIQKCYAEADSLRNQFGLRKPMADWVIPYVRRSLIESQAWELVGRFKRLTPKVMTTANGPNPYLQVTAGKFDFTISMTHEATGLPRNAVFRSSNSLVNYSLFAELEQADTEAQMYAILTHVPHPTELCPAHVGILFPDKDYTTVIHRIDLVERFFATAAATKEAEAPAPNPMPKLRKPRDK